MELKISKNALVAGSGSRGMRQLHFVLGKHIMAWGGTEGGNPQLMVACDLTEDRLTLTGWDIQTG